MAIRFRCPRCGKSFSARAEYVGRRVRCPRCATKLLLPENAPEESSEQIVTIRRETSPETPADPNRAGAKPKAQNG